VARIGSIVFLGTGRFAVPLLRRLPEMADNLLVVTAPPRPAGRGLQPRPSPVATEAAALGLTSIQPERLRSSAAVADLRDFRPDGLLLASYGQLVPAAVLELAPRPPLNVHPSLLPRHRGAAPVAGAILAGDDETGVTLMIMTTELDAGPIAGQWRTPLTGRERADELEASLAELAAERVPPELLRWAAAGGLRATPQDTSQATFTRVLTRDDGRIDWAQPAAQIDRQVRAMQPWPGAWTTRDGRRLHVRRACPSDQPAEAPPGALLPGNPVRIATGRGVLELEEVQPEGRGVMTAEAWRNGLPRQLINLGEAPG
jgi:methionyl-tRNA formyltransferase